MHGGDHFINAISFPTAFLTLAKCQVFGHQLLWWVVQTSCRIPKVELGYLFMVTTFEKAQALEMHIEIMSGYG